MQQYAYGSWHSAYKSAAFPSILIDLPPDFVDYLQQDGLVVDSECEGLPQRCKPGDIIVEGVDYDPEDTYTDTPLPAAAAAAGSQAHQQHPPSSASQSRQQQQGSSSDSDSDGDDEQLLQQPWSQRFPELHSSIQGGIQQLGGSVAPRLNWSSPTDALWMSSSNSLKCSHADEVILLLKSSDRAMHDLGEIAQQQQQQEVLPAHQRQPPTQLPPQQQQQQHAAVVAQLVLRQWQDLAPEREFRCFVHQHRPVAISQKDVSQAFPQLLLPGEQLRIRERLLAFHTAQIGSSFPLGSYAMDVYVPPSGPVRLLDFSPIAVVTSPLLFTWAELPYRCMHTAEEGEAAAAGRGGSSSSEAQPEHALPSTATAPGGGAGYSGCPARQAHDKAPQEVVISRPQEGAAAAGAGLAGVAAGAEIELRVVTDAGTILPGVRAATGMPLDMLGLQESLEDVMGRLQKQAAAA